MRSLADHHIVESNVGLFPLYLLPQDVDMAAPGHHPNLFASARGGGLQPNVAVPARDYLVRLGCEPEDLFYHIVAVLHAPAYKDENAGALRQAWPRVPLPKEAEILRHGVVLGRQVAALLDTETPVAGVTDLRVRPDLKGLGELAVTHSSLQKIPTPALTVSARWGYAGQGGVVMPGPGRVTPGTRGDGFLDIHLNDNTRWKDVPERVWGLHAWRLSGAEEVAQLP
jgi:hypothetical protein